MLKEFKEFAVKGNAIDMAVGIVIGAAFTGIVGSLVDDVIMPPVGWLLGDVDFSELYVVLSSGTPPPPYATLAAAMEAGAVTINYGAFTNTIVEFLIVALAMFFLVRGINRMRADPEEEDVQGTEACPFCREVVDSTATRCPHCTSELDFAQAA